MKSSLSMKCKLLIYPGLMALSILMSLFLSIPCYGTTPLDKDKIELRSKVSLQKEKQTAQKAEKADKRKILFRDGKLTVNVTSEPLNHLIGEISKITGVQFVWQGRSIEKVLSVGFVDRALDEAVQSILQNENYLLFYSSNDESGELTKILILPQADNGEVQGHYFQTYSKNHIPLMATRTKPDIGQWYPHDQHYQKFENHNDIDRMMRDKKFIRGGKNRGLFVPSASDVMAKGPTNDNLDINNKNVIGKEEDKDLLVEPSPRIIPIGSNNNSDTLIEDSSQVWNGFEEGDDDGWQPDNLGRWAVERVEDGFEYCMMPNNWGIPSVSLREDLDVTNSMTISVKALEQGDDDGRQKNFFIVFGLDENNDTAYFAGANLDENTWVIEERSLSHESSKVLDENPSEIINSNTWYDLKLVISGTNVDLYAKQSTHTDYGSSKASFDLTPENGSPDGISGGRIGLGGIYNHAHFDDFNVTY